MLISPKITGLPPGGASRASPSGRHPGAAARFSVAGPVTDFLQACTQSPVNLVLSVLLCVTGLYWLVVILGAVGIDSLDLDFDAGDADVDGDVGAHGFAGDFLEFLNVGKVPILILWSVLLLPMWALGVLTWPWVGAWTLPLQLLAFVPILLVSLLVMKAVTMPIAHAMEKMEAASAAEANVKLLGSRCVVSSLTVDTRSGQVEVATAGAPLKLHARTRDESVVLQKGQEAVLVAEDEDARIYYVAAF